MGTPKNSALQVTVRFLAVSNLSREGIRTQLINILLFEIYWNLSKDILNETSDFISVYIYRLRYFLKVLFNTSSLI
jgi:hypothetical protein